MFNLPALFATPLIAGLVLAMIEVPPNGDPCEFCAAFLCGVIATIMPATILSLAIGLSKQ